MKRLVIVAGISVCLCGAGYGQTADAKTAAPAAMPPECAAWVAAKPPSVSSLATVRRIFVDSFGDDPISAQIQAMVVTQLLQSNRFIVTENRARADAILKGAGVEKTSTESHSFETGTAAGSASGSHSGSVSGSFYKGSGSVSGHSSGGFSAASAAINDAYSSTETINDARASVRMVNQDGDVIWATTQESKGAKYKGASADVADKVVKQLMRDVDRAEKPKEEPTAAAR